MLYSQTKTRPSRSLPFSKLHLPLNQIDRSPKAEMRSPSPLYKMLCMKRNLYGFTFLLGLLALLLTITTFSKYRSLNPFFTIDTFTDQSSLKKHGVSAETTEFKNTIDLIIQRLKEEMREVNEISYTKFLAEILGLVESMQPLNPINNVVVHNEFFMVEEIKKYVKAKPNRLKKQNFMGANATFTSIGHVCFAMKADLEEYMDYDVGDFCRDDWKLAQKLMVHGCDPLPRRRCFSRSPKLYRKPFSINESMWRLPDDHNVRWSGYRCKNFSCLARNVTGKGFFKCKECFNLTHHELPRWVELNYPDLGSNLTSDVLIEEVMKIKPGEIRIGLDFSVGTGTFAARMREFNVTIISATINFGAPFSEMIALRGLLPLYLTINQRLPFFDNTLDIIHTTRFLDGWIDLVFLDFVLYDWDRVLRPGGLLWIDSFFCAEKDLEDYVDAFKMLRYKKHRWIVVPKTDKDGQEVFFSAVLEKPPRPF